MLVFRRSWDRYDGTTSNKTTIWTELSARGRDHGSPAHLCPGAHSIRFQDALGTP